jgi:hypothetical protein
MYLAARYHQLARQIQIQILHKKSLQYAHKDHELVDIYGQNFYPSNERVVPDAIRKLQRTNPYQCQFPLNNSENLIVHWGQGQTFHLRLQSPNYYIPPDFAP